MLTPIQRVPRYEMLLRDYLRRLPENSADRAETESNKSTKSAFWDNDVTLPPKKQLLFTQKRSIWCRQRLITPTKL